MRIRAVSVLLTAGLLSLASAQDESALRWWEGYSGSEANGPHVLGFWKFDGEDLLKDESKHAHQATLRGASWNPAGRFGGCLESSAGYPITDESHSIHIKSSPVLAPGGAFTIELWAKPKGGDDFPAEIAPMLMDMKYVPGNHTGFSWYLTKAANDGSRTAVIEIGLGARTEKWYSQPISLSASDWTHLAFTYDGRGTLTFFVNGADSGGTTKPSAGSMAAATKPLAIGDRIGSLYRGFPGFLDEVRITSGVQQFQPIDVKPSLSRFAFLRMSNAAAIDLEVVNRSGAELSGVTANVELPNGSVQQLPIPKLAKDARHAIRIPVDSSLKTNEYSARITVEVPSWGETESDYRSTSTIPFVIVSRPLPNRMPVVMWGLGGTDSVIREIPRLKEIGFTHCLGLGLDRAKVWSEGAEAMPGTPEQVRAGREMLNIALENDIRIVSSLSPARWLRTAEQGKPFLRVDRNGNHYGREDVSGQFKEVQDFCYNAGLAMSRAYGDHPAFQSALLHTEVRGESQVSFHDVDVAAYREATGLEAPDVVKIKNGVEYGKLPDFPENRVIADDNPILTYLRWFWQTGDGWNHLNTRLHEGLKANLTDRDDFWTFHDPACRVPSISGSGGQTDVLAHWTYSYPDPIRIGLCTDELFEMARVNGHGQNVMKMTQLIWYRSQTAPENATPADTSPWVDQDPDAAYITIAPMHLREAFWWKIARPIQGIMYHGWQSLVETDSPGAYRYTNPNTQNELKRLVNEVVVPLGPMLRQIPDAPADVAFLESFTSQMFARRGTYGWNHTWAGDFYHILMYAQLQPKLLYEESIPDGLEGVKVLVMADCDVLTESVVAAIQKFQANGGLVVGDAEVCPAIKPDYVIERFARTKKADVDRQQLLEAVVQLGNWLSDQSYRQHVFSSNFDVVTRLRQFGTTNYVFAVNDQREFGNYVGGYGLVMENGLPSDATLQVPKGFIYDLLERRELRLPSTAVTKTSTHSAVTLNFGPCEGRILMITERPIQQVEITAPETAILAESATIEIVVTDGEKPIDAVIPLQIQIRDPEGIESEFSGHYGAEGGRLTLNLDIAPNDRIGVWEIRATELASGKTGTAYFRVLPQTR
ncbi:MAG: hypothetical protein ACI8UO_003040 [Verrucomicrobiales bacterium]|jgi:hypothetical protein